MRPHIYARTLSSARKINLIRIAFLWKFRDFCFSIFWCVFLDKHCIIWDARKTRRVCNGIYYCSGREKMSRVCLNVNFYGCVCEPLYDVCALPFILKWKSIQTPVYATHRSRQLKYGAINKIKSFRKCPLAGRKTREKYTCGIRFYLLQKDIYFLIFPNACCEHKVLGFLKESTSIYSVF